MKALAEFIMRGRLQAALVAIIGLPVISNAAIAIVALRRGPLEGSWLLMLAMMPSLLFWVSGLSTIPTLVVNMGLLAAVYWTALVLRTSMQWVTTLFVLIMISAVTALILFYGFPDVPVELQAEIERVYRGLQQSATERGAEGEFPELQSLNASIMAAALAQVIAVASLLSLALGRWWQALLYNPGGFRQEFLSIRLTQLQSVVCLAAAAVCLANPEWQQWSGLVLLPLVVSSIAMAHQFAKAQGLGGFWLVVFYLALIFVAPFRLGMVLLSFADSWMDLRGKLNSNNRTPKDDEDKHS